MAQDAERGIKRGQKRSAGDKKGSKNLGDISDQILGPVAHERGVDLQGDLGIRVAGEVLDALQENGYELVDFAAIACRGGLVRQIPGGTYRVNETLVRDCRTGVSGQHASNLGALIGSELEHISGAPAYIVDPPVVNELSERARYSGYPSIERVCVWHALNQRAVARRYAASVGRAYEDMNLLVCHMGGGVSVGAHVKGKVLDTEDAVSGEGPFSPERAGSLPVDKVVDLWKKLSPKPTAELNTTPWDEIAENSKQSENTKDEKKLKDAIRLVCRTKKASAAYISGKLNVSFPTASRLLNRMEELGVVGPMQLGGKAREVIWDEAEAEDFAQSLKSNKKDMFDDEEEY